MNKPAISKLFKLKKWLTLSEAARHLSGVCGEEVTEADILRLALDKHLKVSVYFVNHTYGRPGHVVNIDLDRLTLSLNEGIYPTELKWFKSVFDQGKMICKSLYIGGSKFLNLEDEKIQKLDDVWDLPMIGGEHLDIEHKWQMLSGGHEVTLQCFEGAFVEGSNGMIYQLQESYEKNEYSPGSKAYLENLKGLIADKKISDEKGQELLDRYDKEREEYLENKRLKPHHEDFYPAGGLPNDSVLVVRTDALRDFEQLLSDSEKDNNAANKPHGNTERFAKDREQVLGAALSVLTQWPVQCQNNSGKFEATKIAKLIDEKSFLFWNETGEPPLSLEKMEREISRWINKIGK